SVPHGPVPGGFFKDPDPNRKIGSSPNRVPEPKKPGTDPKDPKYNAFI
ncbi:14420_t:CDS:1, partial [Ambispora leptoticha]